MSPLKNKMLFLAMLFVIAPALCAMQDEQKKEEPQGQFVPDDQLQPKPEQKPDELERIPVVDEVLPKLGDDAPKLPTPEPEKESWYERTEALGLGAGVLAVGTAYTGYTTCPRFKRYANKTMSCVRNKAHALKNMVKNLQRDELTRADLVRVGALAGAVYGGHKLASCYGLYEKIANLTTAGTSKFTQAYEAAWAFAQEHRKAVALSIAGSMAALVLCKAYACYNIKETDYREAYRHFIKSLSDDDLLAIAAKVKGYDKLFEKASANPAALQDNNQFMSILSDDQKRVLTKIVKIYKCTLEN